MTKHISTAFLFPGQGSQKPGMGEPWRDHASWQLVEAASAASGRDVEDLLLNADAETLRQTKNAQLATFALSMVIFDAVQATGLSADAFAGHSLGEYSALTAAGSVDFVEATRLVTERGEAMQDAAVARPGTMAAVLGLDDDLVEEACKLGSIEGEAEAWVANINAPGQVVIAGDIQGVERASAKASELGAKRVLPVKVSGAFHTPLMAPASERLQVALQTATFVNSSRPVIANVDASAHDQGSDWFDLLSRQLTGSVRWRQSLVTLHGSGIRRFVELGPGSVLTATAKRTVTDVELQTVNSPDHLAKLTSEISPASSGANDKRLAQAS